MELVFDVDLFKFAGDSCCCSESEEESCSLSSSSSPSSPSTETSSSSVLNLEYELLTELVDLTDRDRLKLVAVRLLLLVELRDLEIEQLLSDRSVSERVFKGDRTFLEKRSVFGIG